MCARDPEMGNHRDPICAKSPHCSCYNDQRVQCRAGHQLHFIRSGRLSPGYRGGWRQSAVHSQPQLCDARQHPGCGDPHGSPESRGLRYATKDLVAPVHQPWRFDASKGLFSERQKSCRRVENWREVSFRPLFLGDVGGRMVRSRSRRGAVWLLLQGSSCEAMLLDFSPASLRVFPQAQPNFLR